MRPALPDGAARSNGSLQVRVTREEMARVDELRGKLTRAEWARRILAAHWRTP
jgi:hypothetical protein